MDLLIERGVYCDASIKFAGKDGVIDFEQPAVITTAAFDSRSHLFQIQITTDGVQCKELAILKAEFLAIKLASNLAPGKVFNDNLGAIWVAQEFLLGRFEYAPRSILGMKIADLLTRQQYPPWEGKLEFKSPSPRHGERLNDWIKRVGIAANPKKDIEPFLL